jgi:hypothetical protein
MLVDTMISCSQDWPRKVTLCNVVMFCCCAACEQVLTLKLDTKYWPSWELRRDTVTATWQRHLINGTAQQQPQQKHASLPTGLVGAAGAVASAAAAAATAAPAGAGSAAAASAPMVIDSTTGAS